MIKNYLIYITSFGKMTIIMLYKQSGEGRPGETPPARKLSHLMTMRREQLTKAEAVTVAGVEAGVPAPAAARTIPDRFHRMIRTRDMAALTRWMADSETGFLASFCKGIRVDLVAVTAALTEPWSNGQTEGQITRLKLVKHQICMAAQGLTCCALGSSVPHKMAPRCTEIESEPLLRRRLTIAGRARVRRLHALWLHASGHRFDTLTIAGQQQAGAIGLERRRTIGMPQRRRQCLDIGSKA
jgi:hypothetical protein